MIIYKEKFVPGNKGIEHNFLDYIGRENWVLCGITDANQNAATSRDGSFEECTITLGKVYYFYRVVNKEGEQE